MMSISTLSLENPDSTLEDYIEYLEHAITTLHLRLAEIKNSESILINVLKEVIADLETATNRLRSEKDRIPE